MTKETFNPLVSVIVPVYNGEDYIKEALDSILSQTYENIEIVVVNDGSKDKTEEILKSYKDKIKYFNKENGGVASALNLAIKEAKGEYISWLSADDLYLEEKIEQQINALCNIENKDTILFSDFIVFLQDTKEEKEIRLKKYYEMGKSEIQTVILLLFIGAIHGCSLLIPKKCFESDGFFNEKLKTTQDYVLWFDFLKKGYEFHFIDKITIKTREHKNQDSKSKADLFNKERKKLYKRASFMFISEIVHMNFIQFKYIKETLKGVRLNYIVLFFKFLRLICGVKS